VLVFKKSFLENLCLIDTQDKINVQINA